MASSDALPVPRKNAAYRCVFPILDADGDLVTGATGLDSEVSKDQGTFADCTNEATEIATNSGMYYLDLTSTEMNADCVAVIVKTSSSGAKTTVLVFYPEEAGDIRADAVMVSGDSVAADNLEAAHDGTGYAGGTIKQVVDVGAISGDTTAADNAELMFDGTGYAGGTIRLKTDGPFRKNTALAAFEFMMIDSSDDISGKTGLTVTATRSIDGGAFASCANSVTEVSNGVYKIDLADTDLNGNVITLRFTGSGANPTELTIVTTP